MGYHCRMSFRQWTFHFIIIEYHITLSYNRNHAWEGIWLYLSNKTSVNDLFSHCQADNMKDRHSELTVGTYSPVTREPRIELLHYMPAFLFPFFSGSLSYTHKGLSCHVISYLRIKRVVWLSCWEKTGMTIFHLCILTIFMHGTLWELKVEIYCVTL